MDNHTAQIPPAITSSESGTGILYPNESSPVRSAVSFLLRGPLSPAEQPRYGFSSETDAVVRYIASVRA